MPENLYITNEPEHVDVRIRYSENPEVRNAVRSFMRRLLDLYGGEMLSGFCGRCGNCCINREILITAHETRKISQYLDIPLKEFFDRFTIPASTWNEHDRVIRTESSRCVFLSRGHSGTFKCEIYPCRPFCCVSFIPVTDRCIKRMERMLTEVAQVSISGDSFEVTLNSGKVFSLAAVDLESEIASLEQASAPCRAGAHDKLGSVASDAKKIITGLMEDYRKTGITEPFIRHVESMYEIVDSLDCMTSLRSYEPDMIRELWISIRELKKLSDAGVSIEASGPEAPPVAMSDFSLDGFRFLPETLTVIFHSSEGAGSITIFLDSNPELRSAIRAFLKTLVITADSELLEALGHLDPHCTMCGECCRVYAVEITPIDIERIADHLKISTEAVRENYLEPGRYSWNDQDGVVKRIPKEETGRECVFLEKNDPAVSCCSIYPARPGICRDYTPKSRLCKRVSTGRKWYEHLKNIISLDVTGDTVRLLTYHTFSSKLPPASFRLDDNRPLYRLFERVRDEATKIIQKSN